MTVVISGETPGGVPFTIEQDREYPAHIVIRAELPLDAIIEAPDGQQAQIRMDEGEMAVVLGEHDEITEPMEGEAAAEATAEAATTWAGDLAAVLGRMVETGRVGLMPDSLLATLKAALDDLLVKLESARAEIDPEIDRRG
jgi:hypothetical protein